MTDLKDKEETLSAQLSKDGELFKTIGGNLAAIVASSVVAAKTWKDLENKASDAALIVIIAIALTICLLFIMSTVYKLTGFLVAKIEKNGKMEKKIYNIVIFVFALLATSVIFILAMSLMEIYVSTS